MLISPYTRWRGDELHGEVRVITSVWVRLDLIYVRALGAPSRMVETGLDMTGQVPGRLHGWFTTGKGDWLAVVDFDIPYVDGRRSKLEVADQLVPSYAVRPRGEVGEPAR